MEGGSGSWCFMGVEHVAFIMKVLSHLSDSATPVSQLSEECQNSNQIGF